MENQKIFELLEKYCKGKCNKSERAAVETWYNSYVSKRSAGMIDEDLNVEKALIWKNIQMSKRNSKTKSLNYKKYTAYAATIFAIVVSVLFFYRRHQAKVGVRKFVAIKPVTPGKNGATLTLANGKKISLAEASNGVLADQMGVKIIKASDGKLIYEMHGSPEKEHQVNVISTSKGETYQLRLPDGTDVWLNAVSSLTYTTNLYQDGIRRVKLSGEACFQVAKDKSHPFIVQTDKQEVKVLGTYFNIWAYPDELITKTTLIEGSIRLNNVVTLLPSQQAKMLANGKITVGIVNTDESIAWKNGKFVFISEDIGSVLRKISRWYNVEVIYNGDFSNVTFTGSLSRQDNITEIINKINYTEALKLTIEGRRITVMP